MPENSSTHLYLPDRDRSFWDGTGVDGLPLLYLAWGHRNFYQQTIPVSRHDGWVCAMIEEGAPILRIGDEEMRISAGHVILIGPDCAFGWRGIAGSDCKF
ncbi:MAG: hypothetical protein FJ220_06785, partial [Kiritimatiellaceae bacterium]|nr:hypothetical protein [Kiritimatiellaceae bacterium]